MKRLILNIAIVMLLVASAASVIIGMKSNNEMSDTSISDNLEFDDSNILQLDDSNARVSFSDVILSQQEETRELVVSTQEATESVQVKKRLIQALDVGFTEKSQMVTYTATGLFIVNLDTLTDEDVVVNDVNKTVTIKIEHARLKDIVIDPDKVMIGDVEESLLNRGDVSITLQDYNEIEKELKSKLETALNVGENLQEADDNALKAVKKVYEPVIKAVNSDYELVIAFQ